MSSYKEEIYNWVQEKGDKQKVLVITGPTASGKTGVSIEIAKFLKTKNITVEIINCDSRQIYTDLPITVAVPTEEERENIPHHLFEYISPEITYNVAEWRDDAIKKLKEIESRGNVAILCGGTGLWIDALTKNYTLGVAPNEEFREKYSEKTTEELYEELLEKDPAQAETLGKNKKYLIRALEICEEFGNKTEYAVSSQPEYDFFMMGVTWEREKLYARINARNELMFTDGFLDEAEKFIQKYIKNTENISGYKEVFNATTINHNDCGFIAHGIPEFIQYRNGEILLEELKEKMKQHTRNYAKRQMTWWRKDPRVQFINRETGKKISLSTQTVSSQKNPKFLY